MAVWRSVDEGVDLAYIYIHNCYSP